jgi:hypothetical protein
MFGSIRQVPNNRKPAFGRRAFMKAAGSFEDNFQTEVISHGLVPEKILLLWCFTIAIIVAGTTWSLVWFR